MKPISISRIQTINLLIIFTSASSLALGVALLANYFSAILGATKYLLIAGIVLATASLLIANKLINPKVKQILRIRGGYFFDPSDLKSKQIIGYKFNEDMETFLCSIASENKAYSRALLKDYGCYGKNFKPYNPDELNYYNLAASCTEFIFLRQLSFHLGTYFAHEEIDKSNVRPIPRDQMSSDVLKNRVLELITRNHQEREAFCDSHEEDGDEILCYAKSESGEVYHRLELDLPVGSSLKRMKDNSLKIENRIFEILFSVQCDATNTVIEPELIAEGYSSPWLAKVKLEVLIKKRLFLNSSEIELHRWLDSFLDKFTEYMSIEKLHERSHLQLVRILKSKQNI